MDAFFAFAFGFGFVFGLAFVLITMTARRFTLEIKDATLFMKRSHHRRYFYFVTAQFITMSQSPLPEARLSIERIQSSVMRGGTGPGTDGSRFLRTFLFYSRTWTNPRLISKEMVPSTRGLLVSLGTPVRPQLIQRTIQLGRVYCILIGRMDISSPAISHTKAKLRCTITLHIYHLLVRSLECCYQLMFADLVSPL